MKLELAAHADAAEIDGLHDAGALVPADRQATDVLVLDPPGHATCVAEVGVDVGLVEGAARSRLCR